MQKGIFSMTDCTGDFANLVELYRPLIFRFLLASLREPDLAQTLTQECFLKAYRNRSTFRGESSVKTWLTRIAINLQKDYWRNRRIQFWREMRTNGVDVDLMCDCLPSAERSPEAQLLAREQVAIVWRVVGTLSMRERSVFLLRYVEELELNEIQQCTGLTMGAVKVYLQRAIRKIRVALREDDK